MSGHQFRAKDSEKSVWLQREIRLAPRSRGFHLVTREILEQLPELSRYRIGFLQLLIQHTSASLMLNENASPDVRRDFERHFSRMVPEDAKYYEHTMEGSDDMPAHIKSSILGSGLLIPLRQGHPGLGTWQGVYLCEHRNDGGSRRILATAFGEE